MSEAGRVFALLRSNCHWGSWLLLITNFESYESIVSFSSAWRVVNLFRGFVVRTSLQLHDQQQKNQFFILKSFVFSNFGRGVKLQDFRSIYVFFVSLMVGQNAKRSVSWLTVSCFSGHCSYLEAGWALCWTFYNPSLENWCRYVILCVKSKDALTAVGLYNQILWYKSWGYQPLVFHGCLGIVHLGCL